MVCTGVLMSLEYLLPLALESDKFNKIIEAVSSDVESVQVDGLSSSAKALFIASLYKQNSRPLVFLTYSAEQSERLAEDLPHYGIPKDQILYYPPSDAFIYEETAPDFRVVGERLQTLLSLTKNKRGIVISPINAALRRTMTAETLSSSLVAVKVGDEIDIDELVKKLVMLGYDSTDVVDSHGEYARRGGLIDIFPSNEDDPIRIEFFGDEIESIRHFQTATQRSIDKIPELTILPSREVVLTTESARKAADKIRKEVKAQLDKFAKNGDGSSAERVREKLEDALQSLDNASYFDDIEFYLPYFHPEPTSLFDYLLPGSLILLDEPTQLKAHWEQLEAQMVERLINRAGRGLVLASQQHQHVPFDSTLKRAVSKHQSIAFTLLPKPVKWLNVELEVEISSSPMDSFGSRIEAVMDQVKTWLGNGLKVVFASAQERRMLEILHEYDIPASRLEETPTVVNGVYCAHASLRDGYKLNDLGLMVLADSDVFGAQRLRRARKTSHEGVPISSVLDLKEGDYVVHINHGIGFYRGIKTMKNLGVEKEYLVLEYTGNDTLYVPTDQIDRVQKYIGGEGNAPTVHRLGGGEWHKATNKVKKAVEQMAKELVELYAWREAVPGYAYSQDSTWQQEMESAFPYEETPDQLAAIEDVKRDLENTKSMDRLICGDVGYGKTEVAIRAAFKVTGDGRQAAILAPTTVLAQQHFNTFTERLAAFPVKIGLLSRFRSKKEQQQVVEAARIGDVDIVIGTHRMLSKDVVFKDLGLIIIDEEQRFGVKHKEKLKQLKRNVDVLTLTATPIPRTLHMSLAGLRSMSIINDPPEGRVPIKTFVREAHSETVQSAIVRELDRGGQLFFVHNRVENIGQVANKIQNLVPYARVDIAHGQMPESQLEQVMMDFYEHKFDILVCTTIIESGLDIPNANTIIINESDKMGLSQLYQLRGRVGRSDKQAYAYLLYKPDKMLSEIAEKRLSAIHEFSGLGSGFRIAMRDLEIRGAGNLLGQEQSGNMAAVGFDLYCQLLQKAISEMKGEDITEIVLPVVDLPIDAFIPQYYMPNEAHRILFYKKLAAVNNLTELQSVQDEIEDRFGDPPRSVWNMLAVLRLRLRSLEIGISSINHSRGQIIINFKSDVKLPQHIIRDLNRQYPRQAFASDKLIITPHAGHVISEVEDMVDILPKAFKKAAEYLKWA